MKSKKKNEMENAQNTMEAAQELDMNTLEDVAGGRVDTRIVEEKKSGPIYGRMDWKEEFNGDYILQHKKYDVVDEATGKVVQTLDNEKNAKSYDNIWHHRG